MRHVKHAGRGGGGGDYYMLYMNGKRETENGKRRTEIGGGICTLSPVRNNILFLKVI